VTGDPGDLETNKAIVLRMYEVTNLANVDVMDEVVAANVVNHCNRHNRFFVDLGAGER
jgi:hypothetical protein